MTTTAALSCVLVPHACMLSRGTCYSALSSYCVCGSEDHPCLKVAERVSVEIFGGGASQHPLDWPWACAPLARPCPLTVCACLA